MVGFFFPLLITWRSYSPWGKQGRLRCLPPTKPLSLRNEFSCIQCLVSHARLPTTKHSRLRRVTLRGTHLISSVPEEFSSFQSSLPMTFWTSARKPTTARKEALHKLKTSKQVCLVHTWQQTLTGIRILFFLVWLLLLFSKLQCISKPKSFLCFWKEGRARASWQLVYRHTEFLPAEGMFKYKQELD